METLNTDRLDFLIKKTPDLLLQISEDAFSKKVSSKKWSKKEILGHLIDSATNNHQRFVRAQFENTPSIPYNQDLWNKYSFYNSINSKQLISFWKSYNNQILALFNNMPKDSVLKMCNTGGKDNYSLAFLFNDYIKHLEYHLNQIIDLK